MPNRARGESEGNTERLPQRNGESVDRCHRQQLPCEHSSIACLVRQAAKFSSMLQSDARSFDGSCSGPIDNTNCRSDWRTNARAHTRAHAHT